jgi:predicted MFS family arabinose efflux permease
MLFLIGTFGLNFRIFIATMSVTVFDGGPEQYGFLTSMMALGSITGALFSASRETPRPLLLLAGVAAFGGACALAAVMPTYLWFGMALVIAGAAAQTFSTSANSFVQLSTEPFMRGRVLAILLAVSLGGTPLGSPVAGWVADAFGPRWSLAVGAASGLAALIVGLVTFRGRRDNRDGTAT